mmetsp:Transcript_78480/g.139146  ORF Transcript_78480/g.139146 Transcript_78480/m.139146 type:complete len:282 (+) Transcript_78480:131-976(+)
MARSLSSLTGLVLLGALLQFPVSLARARTGSGSPEDWSSGTSDSDMPVDLDASRLQEGLPPGADAGTDDFETAAAVRRAQKQHNIMQQFMRNFARNMRYSVLADSKGDMPEAERQRLMRQAEADGAGGGGLDADAGSPVSFHPAPEAEEASEWQLQRRPSVRMLNALPQHHSGHHHARHSLRMLNARPPRRRLAAVREESDEQEEDPAHQSLQPPTRPQAQRLGPAEVVHDGMGRAMPLLFASTVRSADAGTPVVKGGVGHSTCPRALAIAAVVLLSGHIM